MLFHDSKLAAELRNVTDRNRRSPTAVVPSPEGVPAVTQLDADEWREATDAFFADSTAIAGATTLELPPDA